MAFPLLEVFDVIGKVVDRVIPDPAEKAKLQLELAELADKAAERDHLEMLGQVEVNKVEAAHRSIFVAGWRPFIGWVGGVGLGTTYIIMPVVQLFQGKTPSLDMSDLLVLLGGMLGFGGMRSFDKLKGTANDVLPVRPTAATAVIPVKKKKKGLDLWPF